MAISNIFNPLPETLKGEYIKLSQYRQPYLDAARKCAARTLPYLIPKNDNPSGASSKNTRRAFSNFGARLVNTLSSKLLMAILPGRQTFFRYNLSDDIAKKLTGTEVKTQVESALASFENIVKTEIETTNIRAPVGVNLLHHIVAGNVATQLLEDGGIKVYPLYRYVVQRDDSGNVLKAVFLDRQSPIVLPDSVRELIMDKIKNRPTKDEVEIYTGVYRTNEGWHIYQECEGLIIPETVYERNHDDCPYIIQRWTIEPGESYGRGMVEDYLDYLVAIEGLTAGLVKGTAAISKVIFMRRPNGQVRPGDVTKAETGDIINGNPDDLSVIQANKGADFATVRQMIQDLKSELTYAFALNEAVQRQAERVTAEEIRIMTQDLDSLLGGKYSLLALEFQLPLVKGLTKRLTRQGKLPAIPGIDPVIVTGLDALGRGAELENLKGFVKDVVDMGGPQALSTYVDFSDLLSRLATTRGIRQQGLIKPPEQVAQEQQQQKMADMVQQLGPNVINQMGKTLGPQGGA